MKSSLNQNDNQNNKCNVLLLFSQFKQNKLLTVLILLSVIIMVNFTSKNLLFNRIHNSVTHTSIFYLNDIHGQFPRMEQIKTASLEYDTFVRSNKRDSLKLCAGDTLIGENEPLGMAATHFENLIGLDAKALGNHEFDSDPRVLPRLLSLSKYPNLGINLKIPPNSPLYGKIKGSVVKEVNGHKYGIMGILPTTLINGIKNQEYAKLCSVMDDEETIQAVQNEADRLTQQGINKIILISHGGHELAKRIAKEVTGVDVILGGHSHELITGLTPQQNYFVSRNNEPVVITQAGRDGNYFGILNLSFDSQGRILSAHNDVKSTDNYHKNAMATSVINRYMGEAHKIGFLRYAEPFPKSPLTEENPYANIFVDAIREELDVDIALLNSGNLRGKLIPGTVTDRDLTSISPFKNKMCVAEISQKEIVDAIKFGLKSLSTPDKKPGILQVSGLSYVANKKGELLELYFLDDGEKKLIDVNNPRSDVKYKVGYDEFYARGKEGFTMLNKFDNLIKKYDFDKDECAIEYIKDLNNKPFDIKKDGRIIIR